MNVSNSFFFQTMEGSFYFFKADSDEPIRFYSSNLKSEYRLRTFALLNLAMAVFNLCLPTFLCYQLQGRLGFPLPIGIVSMASILWDASKEKLEHGIPGLPIFRNFAFLSKWLYITTGFMVFAYMLKSISGRFLVAESIVHGFMAVSVLLISENASNLWLYILFRLLWHVLVFYPLARTFCVA